MRRRARRRSPHGLGLRQQQGSRSGDQRPFGGVEQRRVVKWRQWVEFAYPYSAVTHTSPATADSPTNRSTSSSSPQSPTTGTSPKVSTKPTSAPPEPTLSTEDRQNAARAFNAYNQVVDSITHEQPATWRTSLSRVAAPKVVNAAMGTLSQLHAHGLVSYGKTEIQIVAIVPGPRPRTAIVRNCQDSSKAGLVYPNGNKYTVGRKGVYDEAWVGVINGKWILIGGPAPKKKSC